jgi:hypothetical protein
VSTNITGIFSDLNMFVAVRISFAKMRAFRGALSTAAPAMFIFFCTSTASLRTVGPTLSSSAMSQRKNTPSMSLPTSQWRRLTSLPSSSFRSPTIFM